MNPTEAAGDARRRKAHEIALTCGVLASVVYVTADLVAGARYPGYSFMAQAVSELFAIGAPTSALVVTMLTAYSLLMLGFAGGAWMSAGSSRARRLMTAMIVGNALDTLVLWNFFPVHMRGVPPTFTDLMHAILAVNPFILSTVVCGAVAFRGAFRLYSLVTILLLVVPAFFGFSYISALMAHQPTPWLGLFERTSIYSNLAWHAVLAFVLLTAVRASAAAADPRLVV